MNYIEYSEKAIQLENEYKKKDDSLRREYALSNNPYKIGDIIEDAFCAIKIDSMLFYLGRGYYGNIPSMIYKGVQLKKDLTPRKDGKRQAIHQSEVKVKEQK